MLAQTRFMNNGARPNQGRIQSVRRKFAVMKDLLTEVAQSALMINKDASQC